MGVHFKRCETVHLLQLSVDKNECKSYFSRALMVPKFSNQSKEAHEREKIAIIFILFHFALFQKIS